MPKRSIFLSFFIITIIFCGTISQAFPQITNQITEEEFNLQYQLLSQRIIFFKESNQSARKRVNTLRASLEQLLQQGGIQQDISEQQLQLAQVNIALMESESQRISSSLEKASANQSQLQATMDEIEDQLLHLQLESEDGELSSKDLQQFLRQINTLYELHLSYVSLLEQASDYSQHIISLQQRWYQFLNEQYQQQVKRDRNLAFNRLTQEERDKQGEWLGQLKAANEQRDVITGDFGSNSEGIGLATSIFYLDEKIKLSQLIIEMNYLQNLEQNLFEPLRSDLGNNLSDQLSQANYLLNEVNMTQQSLEETITLIHRQQAIQTESRINALINDEQYQENYQLLDELLQGYQEQLEDGALLNEQFSERLNDIQSQIVIEATKRQGLPGLNIQAWISLGNQMTDVPAMALDYLKILTLNLNNTVKFLSGYYQIIFSFMLLVWLIVWFVAKYFLKVLIEVVRERRQRVSSSNFIYIIVQLIHRNLFALVLFAAFLSFAFLLPINFAVYALLFYLALAWFIFRFIIGIARLTLVERISDVSGADVRLYRGLKWVFLLGGIVTMLTILSYQLNLAAEVQAVSIRLFLLFLLAVSLVLLKGYRVVPSLLESYIDKRRLYLKRTIQLLSILIPLIILSDAIIGLIGYVKLARSMSYYQVLLVVVISLYMVVRGLLIDLVDMVARLMIRHFKNGWLWSEALLKPIDKILRIIIFIVAIVFLFKFYGWGRESIVVVILRNIFTYQFLTIRGGGVTLFRVLEVVILFSVFIWAARWLKEFAYRWVFRGVKDSGVRYSLSNFSQYVIIIVGVLITLRIFDIDYTSFAFILGGLAVGVGFGLRDFANNIISGLMLLFERPVREGDLITVGDFEGRVTHIGLRSIRVRSWDRMEVVVPNSQLFNEIFTNWTRQDNIVRTVIEIRIQREDNVFRVQRLIQDVLKLVPGVLREPEPEVFLSQISDALLEFEVRYFINVAQSRRPKTRSNVLFSIWKRFEEYGIKPPYPQQDIHLKSLPVSKKTLE